MSSVKTLKKFIAFFILGLAPLGTMTFSKDIPASSIDLIPADNVIKDKEVTIYNFDRYDITILSTDEDFSFLYVPQDAASLEEVAEKEGFTTVLNGSFYGGTNLNAIHAGFLQIFGKEITALDSSDPQLSHVIRYDKENNTVKFLFRKKFKPVLKENILEFQAGPLVIRNGFPLDVFINSSLNGLRKHERTLFGVDEMQRKYFVIVRSRVSLREISRFLLSLPVFQGKKLQMINLDGGPSVALYLKNHPDLNFRADKKLPILLGF